MSASRVLWIDLRLASDGPPLSATLPRRYEVSAAGGDESACAAVRRFAPDLAGVEFDYPDAAHMQVVTALAAAFPALPILVFTEYHSEALAVWAFRSGARDYRVKPVHPEVLAGLVAHFAGPPARVHPFRPANGMPTGLIAPGVHLLSPAKSALRTAAAMAYIAAHYSGPVSQGKVASLCHLSRSEFSRVFRREHGITFERFLPTFRVAKARDLLIESGLTITQVAHRVGFSDAAHFARTFKQLVGITASEWRRRAGASVPPHAT